MQTIVTLTLNPAIDTSASVDNVIPEHKLRCTSPQFEPGGGGLNVSRAIRNLGGQSLALYLAGGPTGQILDQLMDQERIAHQAIPIEGWTRESFTIFEESTTQQYRFNMPGPTLTEPEWRRCLDALRELDPMPQYLVASSSLPPGAPADFYAHIARVGNEIGARVIVDTSGEALRLAVQERVYMLKPNLRELGQLSGEELETEEQQEAAARALISSGRCEVLVVSIGAAGVLLVTADCCERFRAPTVPIKSKVGAGDSMVAGIVYALARDLELRDAVRYGVAAGSAAVMTPGSELCRREDTERLYGRMRSEASSS